MKSRPHKKDTAKVQFYADADAVQKFSEFYKSLGMNQTEAGSRLFNWFSRQSLLIRTEILQPFPEEIAPDIARIVLERMAEQDRLRNNNGEPQADEEADKTERPGQAQSSITVYSQNSKKPDDGHL